MTILIFSVILITSLSAQIFLCVRGKSRTLQLTPATICLLFSNAWLLSLWLPNDDSRLGFILFSIFALILAILCGLIYAVFGLVRFIKKRKNAADSNENSAESTQIDEKTAKRKIIVAILQISYIVLVFLVSAIIFANVLFPFNFPYIFFSIVINSIALVFVVKSIIISAIKLIRAKQYFRLGATSVLIFSAVVFVLSGFTLFFASGEESFAIDITDANRDEVGVLIEEYRDIIDSYGDVPDINRATKIEHYYSFIDDMFYTYYEDGTIEQVFVDGNVYSLVEYINDEGYSIYLASPEHTRDLIAVSVTGALSVVSAVTLAVIYTKKRKGDIAPSQSEESATL